jgi:hypothetical protein
VLEPRIHHPSSTLINLNRGFTYGVLPCSCIAGELPYAVFATQTVRYNTGSAFPLDAAAILSIHRCVPRRARPRTAPGAPLRPCRLRPWASARGAPLRLRECISATATSCPPPAAPVRAPAAPGSRSRRQLSSLQPRPSRGAECWRTTRSVDLARARPRSHALALHGISSDRCSQYS